MGFAIIFGVFRKKLIWLIESRQASEEHIYRLLQGFVVVQLLLRHGSPLFGGGFGPILLGGGLYASW